MFWFLNSNENDIEFYQIFTNYNKYSCNSTCYELDTNSNYKIDLSKYEKKKSINCDIFLKGSIIQYVNNDNQNIFTFLFQEEFIKENENEINFPMLYYKYKLTDKYKLPSLSKNNYDFYYEKMQFNIFQVSKETLIIEQIFNNKTKIVFVTKNILEIKKLLETL
jgi:hypothetical protein